MKMDAKTILKRLAADEIVLSLCDDGVLRAWPAGHLQDEHRALIRLNRDALHDFIVDAHALTGEIVEAAMAACEEWGDSEAAREQMRNDILETPAHDKADLLDYFKHYPGRSCAKAIRASKGP
jgi:hypothetical protein